MKEAGSHQSPWYWGAVGLISVAGIGAFWQPADDRVTISKASRPVNDVSTEPSIQDRADQFRAFREEVAQLGPAEQAEVWQSMRERTESLAEQTLYEFFALDEGSQQSMLDRTIDRYEYRRQMYFGRGPGFSRDHGGPSYDRAFPGREVSGDRYWNKPLEEATFEERLTSRRDLWEDATAQASAMRMEFTRMINERRKERGIPEPVYRRMS